ncbi:helix-turn-helix domain-containing protein [Flavobacterium agricola]|uniref:Helix-turn-helix domain-containing protein n=1 Tax=Flavobacterium agricola TaxID=2870839 RepID=A0ABY6M1U4_9FLAO|nr:helix-turn-helix domain-containing protein [Flavobacterium agricola]UYW01767.1 helix-turn-helix domain-containing protein [Flavobacterium agricola]
MKKIDFSQLKHNENTIENQKHFDDNQPKFSNQCKIVYEALLRGEKLTTAYALIHYGIGDLRRRVKDLKDNFNVPVESRKLQGNFKEYYLPKNTK